MVEEKDFFKQGSVLEDILEAQLNDNIEKQLVEDDDGDCFIELENYSGVNSLEIPKEAFDILAKHFEKKEEENK